MHFLKKVSNLQKKEGERMLIWSLCAVPCVHQWVLDTPFPRHVGAWTFQDRYAGVEGKVERQGAPIHQSKHTALILITDQL